MSQHFPLKQRQNNASLHLNAHTFDIQFEFDYLIEHFTASVY